MQADTQLASFNPPHAWQYSISSSGLLSLFGKAFNSEGIVSSELPIKYYMDRVNIMQQSAYPTASIRQYFNVKRTTRNRCCLIFFCIYMLVLIMVTGLALFYANYSNIGALYCDIGTVVTVSQICPLYIDPTYTTCLSTCASPKILYLQIVCVDPNYAPVQSSALQQQITIYNFKQSYVNMIYGSMGLLVGTTVALGMVVCLPKLLYVYVGTISWTQVMYAPYVGSIIVLLLGFSFYLLQTTVSTTVSLDPGSIFSTDASALNPLAYTLLAFYLVFFPTVLFTPTKLHLSIKILSKLRSFFDKTFTMSFFSGGVAIMTWGLIILLGFILMSMFSAGTATVTADSFFYSYSGIQLSHPGILAFYFFGVYWFFSTLVSWHRCFVGSTVALWYFHQQDKLHPVKRGLKRSWYHLGTAAYDGILLPVQLLLQTVYKIIRVNKEEEDETAASAPRCMSCRTGCSNGTYSKINRHGLSCTVLTHLQFKESCAMAAQMYATNKHVFHGVGGMVSLFVGLFCGLAWIVVTYLVLRNGAASIGLPLGMMGATGVVVGAILSNIYTSAMEVVLFCYLMERQETKGVLFNQNQVKALITECYFTKEKIKVVKMYANEQYEE